MMGDANISITVEDLTRIFQILVRHVEEIQGPEIVLDKDYFWSVPQEDTYDVLRDPDGLTIGQLTQNVSDLRELLDRPDDALSYELVWLGDLLRAIGHTITE